MTLDKDGAVLQGSFLLADKLSLPASLASLEKADWTRVGGPVVEAFREICGGDRLMEDRWKTTLVCAVWLKVLGVQAEDDLETSWRENPFFPLQNGLPDLNSAVLLELVRSVAAEDVFARLLLRLPPSQICVQLRALSQHVRSRPVREEDVKLFLDVWWEVWKSTEQEEVGEGSVDDMFARQCARLSSSASPQDAKRLKLDTEDGPSSSSPSTNVLQLLLHALKDMKEHVSWTDVCLQALSVALDSLYTSFLVHAEVTRPTKEMMQTLSKAAVVKAKDDGKLSLELLREVQRDVSVAHKPSRFQSCTMDLGEAANIITDLAQFWKETGLLNVADGEGLTYSAFRLQQSVRRILAVPEDTELKVLRDLLKTLVLPSVQTTPEVEAKVTMTIINHRLEDFENFAALLAGEKIWASRDKLWFDCVEKNQTAFQQPDTLIRLASTLMAKLHQQSSDASLCRKLINASANIFSALSLEHKNQALAAMLGMSSKGFFGCEVPPAVTEGFEQELNMGFNCIIQGGGGTSSAGLNTAASLVARVAFQNPEATLKSCCHSAVFNKGAFSLMARILQRLPGLRGPEAGSDVTGESFLCRCLDESIQNKPLSASEKEQLLGFVTLMMTPVEEGEKSRSFLSPQDVVNVFVLPHLSPTGEGVLDIEMSLKLLHAALSLDLQDPKQDQNQAPSPHWLMSCSPFPLLYVLTQLQNHTLRVWQDPPEGSVQFWSMDTQELLDRVLVSVARVVGTEVAQAPETWSRAIFWLYDKMQELDWTVRFYLKPVWREHFKNEVPLSLLTVCDLPEQDWSGLDLPQYGPGTGLLAWMECCSISDSLRSTMLSHLSLDQDRPDHIIMFSKGLQVALTQTLPCRTVVQWSRLMETLRELISSGRLHVPFSLEYVDYLPLLDLRRFSCDLGLSVLLLRVLQLLSGSSCSTWLCPGGWTHLGQLLAHAVKDLLTSLKAKLPLSVPGTRTRTSSETTAASREENGATDSPREPDHLDQKMASPPSREVLFVLGQMFCHVQHVQVMMPVGPCDALFLSSLEILSLHQSVMCAFPDSSSAVESEHTRHFFTTIAQNLQDQEMKEVLQQKISQLVMSPARR